MTTVKNDSNDGHGSCLRRAPERQAPAPARRIQAQAQVWLPLSQVLGHPWAALRGPPWGLHGLTSGQSSWNQFQSLPHSQQGGSSGNGTREDLQQQAGLRFEDKGSGLEAGPRETGEEPQRMPLPGAPWCRRLPKLGHSRHQGGPRPVGTAGPRRQGAGGGWEPPLQRAGKGDRSFHEHLRGRESKPGPALCTGREAVMFPRFTH